MDHLIHGATWCNSPIVTVKTATNPIVREDLCKTQIIEGR